MANMLKLIFASVFLLFLASCGPASTSSNGPSSELSGPANPSSSGPSSELKSAILRELQLSGKNVMVMDRSTLDSIFNCVAKKVDSPQDAGFKDAVNRCS